MRKHYLTLAAAMLMCMGAIAQKFSAIDNHKGFVMVSAGPSFPLGEYSSTDINKAGPGFAKTGYNVNIHFGYSLTKHFGVSAAAFYTRHDFDNGLFAGTSASADHWQYVGVVAGVLATQSISSRVAIDLNVMTGAADVNSPKIVYSDQEIMNEAWAVAVPLKTDFSLRYQIAPRWQVIAGVNYLYMDPTFNVTTTVPVDNNNNGGDGGEYYTATAGSTTTTTTTHSVHQVMSVIGVHAGIGISF